jgi:hypothetical protein
MSPDSGPFQEPDAPQLLLIVDAEDPNRIGHEQTANKYLFTSVRFGDRGAQWSTVCVWGSHALLAGIGFTQKRVAWVRRPFA